MRQIACKFRLQNDPLCVKCDIKLSSLVSYDTLLIIIILSVTGTVSRSTSIPRHQQLYVQKYPLSIYFSIISKISTVTTRTWYTTACHLSSMQYAKCAHIAVCISLLYSPLKPTNQPLVQHKITRSKRSPINSRVK